MQDGPRVNQLSDWPLGACPSPVKRNLFYENSSFGFQGQHRRNSRGLHRLCVPSLPWKKSGPCLVTLLKFNIFAPEKWCLEDDPFLLGWGYYFQGRTVRLPGDITIFTEKSWNTRMREGKLEDVSGCICFCWSILSNYDATWGKRNGWRANFLQMHFPCIWRCVSPRNWRICYWFFIESLSKHGHRTGIITWEPFTGGEQTMQMHGKFEGFPQKYHWNPLKQIGTFRGASRKKNHGQFFPKMMFFFWNSGEPLVVTLSGPKRTRKPIFNKKLIFNQRVHFYIAMLVYQGVAQKFVQLLAFKYVWYSNFLLRFEQHAFRLKFWQGVIKFSYLEGIKLDAHVDFWMDFPYRFVHAVWVGVLFHDPCKRAVWSAPCQLCSKKRWDSWVLTKPSTHFDSTHVLG